MLPIGQHRIKFLRPVSFLFFFVTPAACIRVIHNSPVGFFFFFLVVFNAADWPAQDKVPDTGEFCIVFFMCFLAWHGLAMVI